MIGGTFPVCVVCAEEVNFRQHALCCDHCSKWQHRLCNSGVTFKNYKCLTQGEIEMAWHCAACPSADSKQSPKIDTKVAPKALPAEWIKKTEQTIQYISPNGRRFHSKKQALKYFELHYQVANQGNSTGTPSPTITKFGKINTNPMITPNEMNDEILRLQPFIPLHRLNKMNNEQIEKYQPHVYIERLSPLSILRETNENKQCSHVDGMSVMKAKIKSKHTNIKGENNNQILKFKMKKKILAAHEIKMEPDNGIIQLKPNNSRNPVKVKAQMKKHSMNIRLQIDRKSLNLDQTEENNLNYEENQSGNSFENKWNIKLGSVKIKNQHGKLMSSAKKAKKSSLSVKPLVWLHISLEDIQFGLIS